MKRLIPLLLLLALGVVTAPAQSVRRRPIFPTGGPTSEGVVWTTTTNLTGEGDGGWTATGAGSETYGRSTQVINTGNNTNGIEFVITGATKSV